LSAGRYSSLLTRHPDPDRGIIDRVIVSDQRSFGSGVSHPPSLAASLVGNPIRSLALGPETKTSRREICQCARREPRGMSTE
jgi:hypothetical protein